MRRTVVLLSLVLSPSCGAGEVGPTARIDLTPDTLCEGAEDTAVIISGKRSSGLSEEGDLSYGWSFSRPPARTIRGGTEDPEIVVEFSTETAVRVALAVTDSEGRAGVREQILGVTRTARVPCAGGCADHEICVPFATVELCVDDLECTEDAECGCLVCRNDDLGSGRCVASE